MKVKTAMVEHASTVSHITLLQNPSLGEATDRSLEVHRICLAIKADKFFELLLCKAVCINDFHCLDACSKQRVWQWYLEACRHG